MGVAPHSIQSVFPARLARLRPLEARLGWLPLGAQYVAFARKT